MVYAILSDIHANLSALKRVLADARESGAEKVICLGDVVGYGPLPSETLALVRRSAALTLAGNHDDAVSGRIDAANFIDLAGDAVQRHRDALTPDDLAWLKSLPHVARLGDAVLAHGDFTEPAAFNYVDSEDAAQANFEAIPEPLAFVGHTHVPGLFLVGHSGTVYRTDPQDFMLENGKRYIVNPGSVGYPRESNGTCQSSYVLYDSAERSVRFRFLPFAVSSVMQRGLAPRRLRKRTVAAIVVGVSAAIGVAVHLLSPKAEVVNRVEIRKVAVAEDPALVLARKTIAIAPDRKNVRANLEMLKPTAHSKLAIRFLDARGQTLLSHAFTILRSSRKCVPIPVGATAAEFTVLKFHVGDRLAIKAFEPIAE